MPTAVVEFFCSQISVFPIHIGSYLLLEKVPIVNII